MIYCFGDSHVSVFTGKDGIMSIWEAHKPNTWDQLPQFRTYRLGSYLAYSIGRENHQGRKMLFETLKEIPDKSNVLLIFGEIDCRLHLVKQAQIQQKPLLEIITDCVIKYLKTANIVSELGHRVIIFGGIPNGHQSNVSRLFDLSLKQECAKLHLSCLSIFDKLVDENGTYRNHKYLMGDACHLSQVAMPLILEELAKILVD